MNCDFAEKLVDFCRRGNDDIMLKTIKCENCGANMNTDTDNAMRFCPFCGAAMQLPEDIVDLAKFTLKHEEKVRQKKVEEHIAEDKRSAKVVAIIFGSIFGVILLALALFYGLRGNADAKLEKLTAEVQQMILDGDYDQALIMAQSIRVEKEGLFDEHFNRWENQRKDLIRLIEQKKKESSK